LPSLRTKRYTFHPCCVEPSRLHSTTFYPKCRRENDPQETTGRIGGTSDKTLSVGQKGMMKDSDTPMCVATFSSEMEADMARMRLDSSGIESFVAKDDCGGMRPWFQPLTGVRLMVKLADAERAAGILHDEGERKE